MLGVAHQNSGKVARTAAYTAVVLLLLSPVVVPAVAAKIYAPAEKSSTTGWANRFTPAGIDSRLADRMTNLAVRQTAFPFTPAGLNNRGTNILTVAARADSGNAVSVRNAIAQIGLGSGTTLRLSNSNYQLTAVRGWQAFEMPKTLVEQPRLSDLVGKGSFRLDDNDKKKPSRFNSDVSVAPAKALAPSPRGNAAAGNYDVNVGGSFRLTKGIDVTAGIRYSRDNGRVDPSTQIKADNEAVYVGTKIRF